MPWSAGRRTPTGRCVSPWWGKYTQLHDAYLSVVESLNHAGTANDAVVDIKWVDSETLTEKNVREELSDVSGVLVPGGFGDRGIEGMICAVRYARENGVPYFGICLGMQMAVIEFARHVLGYADANSSEFSETSQHPVIDLMPDQVNITDKGRHHAPGQVPCVLLEGTRSRELYGQPEISERHRHRFEFNNDYREEMQSHGMTLAGLSPNGRPVEIVELPDHPGSWVPSSIRSSRAVPTGPIRCSSASSGQRWSRERTRSKRIGGTPGRRRPGPQRRTLQTGTCLPVGGRHRKKPPGRLAERMVP